MAAAPLSLPRLQEPAVFHSSPAPDATPRWPVLVVSADAARVAEVRLALRNWPQPVAVNVATTAMAAMRQALSQPLRLVVVDWAVDGPGGQALVRQLARLRQEMPVVAFDALGVGGPAEQVLAWPWDELSSVLDHWRLMLLVDERGARAELTT